MRPAALLLLLALTACGQQPAADGGARDALRTADPAVTAEQATALLRDVPGAARRAGAVTYTAVAESFLDDEPASVDLRLSGALDTAAGAGTADVALTALDGLAAAARGEDDAAAADLAALSRTSLWWTPEELTLEMGGEQVTGPRDDLDSGLLPRVPAEPAGLFDVAAGAREIEVVGAEQLAGVATTHLRAVAEPRPAVDAGLGTQAHLAIAALPDLPLDVWLDDAGRPARIRYEVTLPSARQGRSRTVVTTYDYRDWGTAVDVTP